MKVNLIGLSEEILKVVNELNKVISIELSDEGESVNVSTLDESSKNAIEIKRGNENYIKYKEKHHFFRALGLYIQLSKNGTCSFERNEKVYIESVGTMIDASRNAVYKVEEVKKILINMSLMGQNRCMLYTEDTYEVDGYKYFGYLRGKYTKEELREIDDFAYLLGIEVIPCIQTLAHLKQTLRWDYGNNIKDTQDVLLIGEEKTYDFIEAMISSVRSVFRSKNIHIGMDEAFDLGRGEYLTRNGHVSHKELMIKHLNKVCEITKKYDFNPMIWDDMFLRSGAPNGGYYDVNAVITKDIADNIPEEVSLVYWDYYTDDEEKYSKLLDIRKAFNNKIIFAGGCWRWEGYSPTYSRTFITTNAALSQCKKKGINEVFATAWGDDGSETPINAIMLGLILFGEHGYCQDVDDNWLNERCEFLTSLSMDDFTCLEDLDLIPTVKKPNVLSLNPSKYLMFQDILLGAFDKHIEGLNLKEHYETLAEKYASIASKTETYKNMYDMYANLSKFLSLKSEIGLDITKAYLSDNKVELKNIVEVILPQLKESLIVFHDSVRKLWYKECKGHGFEVTDIRLGGVLERIKSTTYRLNQYLNNEIAKIEELEEERLYFSENISDECKQISFNQYQRIATQNILTW